MECLQVLKFFDNLWQLVDGEKNVNEITLILQSKLLKQTVHKETSDTSVQCMI